MKDHMCEVTFKPMDLTVQVPVNTSLMNSAIENDIPLEGPCNGKGTCGKCLVKVRGKLSEPTSQEIKKLGQRVQDGGRLACQARVLGNAEVTLNTKNDLNTLIGGRSEKYDLQPTAMERFGPREKLFGVAVDIGTTSIVASLMDLNTGRDVASAGSLNPQTVYGGDILTRIEFAHQSPDNLSRLKSCVVDGVNALIESICRQGHIKTNDIYHIVIAANTTMLHLLVGIDPISLAVAPYQPVFVDYKEFKADELGILGAQDAVVSLLPSLSAFVGADILAGVLATGFHKLQVPSLFVDIGTNGEIVANVNGQLAATSSAAGPALEGMNIHHGCRAEDGAISEVTLNENGELVFKTIGNAKSKGICGSGLVDLIALLVRENVILESGRFNEPSAVNEMFADRLINFEGQRAFLVDTDQKILLTQGDIRQVQLAKGAIAAAIEILFKRLGIGLDQVQKLYIAGGFGYHLKPQALRTIGLIPPGLNANIEFVGNTAKEGAELCLTSKTAVTEIIDLQKAMRPLELSYAPEFQENFVEHLEFPLSEGE